MKKLHKYFLSGLLLGFFGTAVAQRPMALYFLENVPQSTLTNPAMAPRANAYFGLPIINTIYTGYYSDLLGAKIFQQTSNGDWVTLTNPQYDFSPLYKKLNKAANIRMFETTKPLMFGFRGKKGYFMFGVSEKLTQTMNLPVDFIKIFDRGIPDGTNIDLSQFAFNAKYYREFSFGYSYQFMKELRVGANVKFLQGLAAIKTDLNKFNINATKDEWDMSMDGGIYMSAPVEFYTSGSGIIPDSVVAPSDILKTVVSTGITNLKNPGIAVDLGAVYNYNEDWSFSAALNDMGFIRWQGNLNSFTAKGSYKYTGIDINESNIDSLGNVVHNMMDSIGSQINFQHGHKGFSTGIGPKLYLSGQYHLNQSISCGLLSRTLFFKNDFRQEFTASFDLNLYDVLTTSVNYTVSTKGYSTFGLGLALRGGPLQIYLASDYIPLAYRTIKIETTQPDGSVNTKKLFGPNGLNNFNLMIGLNFLIEPNGFKDDPMIDTYNSF